jgi:branched-chain amino acid aminotransferase
MTVAPLPPPLRASGAVIEQTIRVNEDDLLARHKTLNYWRKRIAHAHAVAGGFDDVLGLTAARLICETSRANIFLIERGRLSTPCTSGPLLPGVMRAVVLERARRTGLNVEVGAVSVEQISTADEAFLTSSLRGMLPLARLLGRDLPAPGPMTRQLWNETLAWLESGGTAP